MNWDWRSIFISAGLHAAILGGVFLISGESKALDDAPMPVPVISLSDPLLASLADPNADPNKAAGIVGEKPGLADGEPDPELAKQIQSLEEMNEAADSALEKDLPEPEPPAPEPEPVPAAKPAPAVPVAKPAPAVPKKAEPKKAEPKKPTVSEKKPSASTTEKPKKTSFAAWQKSNQGSSKKTVKKSSSGKKSTGGKATVAKIDVSKIGVGNGGGSGSGSGKKFGVPGGTGGNGGDGGRAIASAQQAYAAEVARKFGEQLDIVLAQDPLTLNSTMTVSVRLNVAADGSVSLLEVVGSSDSKVRERVLRAVARIGKFRVPPEKKSFPILVPEVALRPL